MAKAKMPRRRPWSYPMVIFRDPAGKLYPECNYCGGTGYNWIRISSSDQAGQADCYKTKHPCRHCGGLGYDRFGTIRIQDVSMWVTTPGRHTDKHKTYV